MQQGRSLGLLSGACDPLLEVGGRLAAQAALAAAEAARAAAEREAAAAKACSVRVNDERLD